MRRHEIIRTLKNLIKRVERNTPRHGDPEAFHDEKREIADGMTEVLKAMEGNRVT